MQIAIIDSSSTPWAEATYYLKALRTLGYETVMISDNGPREEYVYNVLKYKNKGFITICIASDLFSQNIDPSREGYNSKNINKYLNSAADYIFVGYKPAMEILKNKNIYYLPYAVDTSIYYPLDIPVTLKAIFVGRESTYAQERSKKLDLLKHVYGDMFEKTGGVFFEACASEYARAKIVFNYSSGQEINMRIFEALACRKLLMTNRTPYLEELFEDGKHLIIYKDDEDLIRKINYYTVDNNEARETIANQGYEEVKKHTYLNRAMEIVKIIDNDR